MAKKFKVALIANDNHPIPEWVYQKFIDADIGFVVQECYSREDLEKIPTDTDVILLMSSRTGLVVEENMDLFKNVGMAIKCGSGTDNIDHAACTKRGIIVGHTPDDPTEPTSDHFIAMLFTAVRQTARQDRLVRRGVWKPTAAPPLAVLTGAELGLIGFGRVGKMIVRKLSGFQMNIRVYDPYIDGEAIETDGCKKVELEELLRQSQLILVACPLTEDTTDLISEDEFNLMRPDAILVNTARAGIVNEKATIKALKENRIKVAAFDVLEKHPLEPGDEWLDLENTIYTPHTGGYPADYPDRLFTSVVDVIIEVSKGYLPRWIANPGVKPKWDLKEPDLKV